MCCYYGAGGGPGGAGGGPGGTRGGAGGGPSGSGGGPDGAGGGPGSHQLSQRECFYLLVSLIFLNTQIGTFA